MASDDTDYRDVISRRRFIELTGVTGAAALAGCGGDGGSDGEGGGDGSGGDGTTGDGGGDGTGDGGGDGSGDGSGDGESQVHSDVRHEGVTTLNPTDAQWNPVNSDQYAQISHYLVFEDFATYNFAESEFQPAAIDEWEVTGDAVEMTLRDDLVWTNGDDVTAEDVVTQLKIAEYDEDPMWEWADGVEAASDTEVTVSIGQEVNPALVEADLLDRRLALDRATYGEHLESLENGGDIAEVRDFDDTDPVTNGPFQISQKDDQILLTTRFEDSPYAGNINFAEYAFNFIEDNNARQQALQSMEVDSDYSVSATQDVKSGFPDAVEEVTIPDIWGLGLAPNHNHPHAGDRAVRQAIQYVIDRETCVQNSQPGTKIAPEIPTGIPTDYQEDWLGDEFDAYDTYGKAESQTEEATAVLEDAGYQKVDGTWQDSDGNVVSLPITHPQGWGDWTLALETAQDQLNQFGFDVTLEGTGDYFGDLTEDDWVIIANTWLHGGPTPYPYYSLRHQLREPVVQAAHTNYPGYTEQYGGSGADVTVPARDGSGETTINPADRLEALATTSDENEETQIVRELAWLANQDLPRIPIKEKRLQQWLTSDEWDVPDNPNEDPDAKVNWAPTHLPRAGKMNYSG